MWWRVHSIIVFKVDEYPFLEYLFVKLGRGVHMSKSQKKYNILKTPDDEALDLIKRVNERSSVFTGNFDELEKAIGMLFLGRLVGWRVLVLLHNKRTIRKYENILDIKVREFFEEEGPLASKSVSYDLVKKTGNFWKVVSGDAKVENRRELS